MNTGLEALNTLISHRKFGSIEAQWEREECRKTIEKELKALEIIKNKSVNTRNLIIYCFEMKDTYKNYVEVFNYCDNYWELGKELLTEEEFNLLKEVLL